MTPPHTPPFIQHVTANGGTMCGEPQHYIPPGITVIFCKKCIDILKERKPDDAFAVGVMACIEALKRDGGIDGSHGFSPAYLAAAEHLEHLWATGQLQS